MAKARPYSRSIFYNPWIQALGLGQGRSRWLGQPWRNCPVPWVTAGGSIRLAGLDPDVRLDHPPCLGGALPDFYSGVMRPLLFQGLKADPEWLHQRSLHVLAWLGADGPAAFPPPPPGLKPWLQRTYSYPSDRLQQTLWGQTFANPLGLAAGFDKDGVGARAWPLLGFGFAEAVRERC